MNETDPPHLSRRFFLQSAGGVTAAIGTGCASTGTAPDAPVPEGNGLRAVQLSVNGKPVRLQLEARVTLLDALRNHVGLTGTKKGCDRGQCGACTVLADGRRINACLTLAVMQDGAQITTVEGLGTPGALHPVQAAFVRHDGFQCGYCTPGQVCSAVAVLGELRANTPSAVTRDVRQLQVPLSDDEIRERMSGNICRCGAYPGIVAAVRELAAGGASA